MMKKILIPVVAALAMASCGAGGGSYDPARCENLITAVGQAKNMQDVTKDQWRELYRQYMALDASVRSQVKKLIDTPWSTAKEKDVNELLASKEIAHWRLLSKLLAPLANRGFAPSAYFSAGEVADMQTATETTMLEINHLLAQADLDGK